MNLLIGIITVSYQSRLRSAKKLADWLSEQFDPIKAEIFVDHEMQGIWWNTARVLKAAQDQGKHCLIFSDDSLPRKDVYMKHFHQLYPHLKDYGLISMFTPPRDYSKVLEQGFNCVIGNDFMWPYSYLVNNSFIPKILETAEQLDFSVVKQQHDELRFRVASQVHDVPMVTVMGSLCEHDLALKSTVGTASSIGGRERNTSIFADETTDFTVLKGKYVKMRKDLKYLKK